MNDKNIITSDDILGKQVVDSHGDIIGIIQQLHIDKHSKEILGITVDQGFMKPDIFIGLQYIKQFGIDTVFLNTFPKDKIKGMEVINCNGRKIGVVSSIDFLGKDSLKSIKVSQGMLKKPVEISVTRIKEIGYNIILKDEGHIVNME